MNDGNNAHLPDQELIMTASNVPARSKSLLPESLSNIIESFNCGTRIVLKGCQGAEKTMDGLDEISSLMLRQQRQRLLAELELEPETILIDTDS